ncbi:MAG: hypothetical protein M3Q83_04125 [Pseudomonadota bacterium]|nr:hypothetical protein [Pseudomonadota bacterium]
MASLIKTLGLLPLLLAAACSVTEENNGSTTLELDENRIDAGAEALANEAGQAAEAAGNAIENAGPAIEQSADDIQERAGRVADRIDNVDVDVDLNTSEGSAATNAN